MKITNETAIQIERALPIMGGTKAQATSSGRASRSEATGDTREHAPVQNKKPSSDASQHIDAEAVNETVRKINEQMSQANRSIEFSVDDKTKEIVIKVVDKSSGEVIRQIPAEDVLKMRENMDTMAGLLIKKTV